MRAGPVGTAVAAVVSVGVGAWAVGFGHPVLLRPGPLRDLAVDLAGAGHALRAVALTLHRLDAVAGAAAAALVIALLVLAVQAMNRALPARPGLVETARHQSPAAPVAAPVAVLVGHGAGCIAVMAGVGPGIGVVGFYLTAWWVTAGLWFLPRRRSSVSPTEIASPPVARIVVAVAVGLCVVAVSSVPDSALAAVVGAPLFPEGWHAIFLAPLGPDGWWTGPVLAAALVLAVAGVERADPGAAGPLAWLWSRAPAYALLLGPSQPARSVALAFVLETLRRGGVGWRTRCVVVLLFVAGMAVAAVEW